MRLFPNKNKGEVFLLALMILTALVMLWMFSQLLTSAKEVVVEHRAVAATIAAMPQAELRDEFYIKLDNIGGSSRSMHLFTVEARRCAMYMVGGRATMDCWDVTKYF